MASIPLGSFVTFSNGGSPWFMAFTSGTGATSLTGRAIVQMARYKGTLASANEDMRCSAKIISARAPCGR